MPRIADRSGRVQSEWSPAATEWLRQVGVTTNYRITQMIYKRILHFVDSSNLFRLMLSRRKRGNGHSRHYLLVFNSTSNILENGIFAYDLAAVRLNLVRLN